ncbi:MAG: Ig-like domain-containing protein [Clostridium sp.]|nr:Ig-like domain-containing protein [Clostridium sp.]
MKNKGLHKYLAWLLAFALILSLGSIGSPIEAMAKSKSTAAVKSVSLKIGNQKVTKKTYKMERGDKKKIKVSVSPKKGKKTITFSTSNKKVAAVNKNGSVTAKKEGTAKITVTVRAKKTGKSSGTVKKKTWVKIKVANPSSNKKEDTTEAPETQNPSEKRSIVVYFSCTDNTKTIAEYVAESAGADIYRIEPSVPYTTADLNYSDADSRTSKEQNDATARPGIAGSLPSLNDYEVVYLGFPIWWGQAPKIMYTFIENYDLSGKIVVPFCTSGGSGIGTSATNLQAADTSQATWLPGRRFSGSSPQSDVVSWLAGLELE